MNCGHCRDLIAVSAERALAARPARHLERHLGGCPDCRGFQARMLGIQDALRNLAAAGFDETALEGMRRRVLERIGARPRMRRRRWPWAAVPLAAASIPALLWLTMNQPVPPPSPRLFVPPAPVVFAPAPVPKAAPARLARRKPGPPLLMRLETGDPNVVIYWVIGGKAH